MKKFFLAGLVVTMILALPMSVGLVYAGCGGCGGGSHSHKAEGSHAAEGSHYEGSHGAGEIEAGAKEVKKQAEELSSELPEIGE